MDEKKEKPDASVSDVLQYVCDQMCLNYCKWREKYNAEYADSYEAEEKMMEERCNNCPLVHFI